MRKIIPPILGFTVCAIIIIPAFACLWDFDTLRMETQRFPDALELITGKFLRHSPEFYQWRIIDRIKKLETDPQNLAYYDDLAVAYEKTGDHQKAIETILKKDKIKPDQYETLANLGTFYIFDNQLEKSVRCIERAIAINPDAHFGREVYQKLLVQYALSRRKDGKIPLPLSEHQRGYLSFDNNGFWNFLCGSAEFKHVTGADIPDEHKRAVKGVLGMMKFASFDSPLLLEALGDLLLSQFATYDAKQLAARAYLKASYEVKDEVARKAYRKMAEEAISLKKKEDESKLTLNELEPEFAAELKEAESWYANVRSDEIQWINAGLNPEEQFTAKYYTEPRTTVAPDKLITQKTRGSKLMAVFSVALAFGLSALFIGLMRRLRAK